MQPEEIQNNNNEVELEAILLETQNQGEILDDIRVTNEAQVLEATKGNEELRELNSSVDILIEKLTEEKPLKREDVDSIIDILTAIRDKETAETKVVIEVNGIEIESSKLYEEIETGN